MSEKKNRVNAVFLVSIFILVLVVFFGLASFGVRLLGYQTIPVLTSEMSPEYRLGSLAYVKKVDIVNIKPEMVISFSESDGSLVSIQRVKSVLGDGFETAYDVNTNNEVQFVLSKEIIGCPEFSIPFVGYFVVLVRNKMALLFLSMFLLILIILISGKTLIHRLRR